MWYVQNSAKPITCRDFHHQSGHTSTPEPTKVSLWNAWMNLDSFLQPERATRGHLGWPTLKSWKMRSMGDRPGIRFNGDMFVLCLAIFCGIFRYIDLKNRPEIYGRYMVGTCNESVPETAVVDAQLLWIRSDTSATGWLFQPLWKIWKVSWDDLTIPNR